MVGIKKLKIILGIFIPFLGFFVMSQNTFAERKDFSGLSFMYNTPYSSTYVSSGILAYDQTKFNIHSINELATRISSVSVPANANFLTYTAKFNLLTWTDNGYIGYLPNDYGSVNVYNVAIDGNSVPFESATVQRFITDFSCDPLNSGIQTNCRTFTYQVSFVVRNIPSSISSIVFGINYGDASLNTGYSDGFNAYFQKDINNFVSVDFSFDYTSALLQQQIQQQEITINSINNINTTIEEQYQKENEAIDNIDNQSSSDIQGTENQQTTNLIGIITNFINTLRGNGTSTNCNIILPFPEFLGGSRNVNLCEGKDKLLYQGNNYITVFGGRFLMICFFVPLIWILIKLIYNEIRSWTNG